MGLEFARGAVWGNQVHTVLLEVVIESIAVIGPIADEMLEFGLEHVEIKTGLDQGDFMMSRRVRTDGEGEPVSIHNRANLQALTLYR